MSRLNPSVYDHVVAAAETLNAHNHITGIVTNQFGLDAPRALLTMLLTDLLHLCAYTGVDFEVALEQARIHHADEADELVFK